MSQRARVLGILALAVLPLVLLVAARIWQQYEADTARIAADRLARATMAAFAVQTFVDSHVATVRTVALHPGFAAGRATPELQEFLRRIASENPDWAGAALVGPAGYAIVASRGANPVYIGDREYFRRAIDSGRPAVSSALIGRLTGRPTIVIAAPVALEAGGRAALVAPLPTDQFAGQLLERFGEPSMALAVVDGEARTFIHTERSRAAALEPVRAMPGVAAALNGEQGTLLAPEAAGEVLVAHAPVPGYGWGVVLSEPAEAAFADARRLALERAAGLAAALVLVAAIGWILGGRLAVLVQRAVSARAEADAARANLERALRTRDEFLAAAAHDLRNPLALARTSTDLLEQSVARTGSVPPERLAMCLRHIDSALRRMAAQLDGFLDVARLQMGAALALDLGEVDLVPLVRQMIDECRQTSPRHRFSLEAPPALPARADAARLQRAIGNLLHNAIKYSADGGSVLVTLSRSADGARALVAVRDHGIGIAPEDLERIFERFERGSNVVGRIPGTGIGLAGARQIVEQHGGTLSVQSVLGEGSVFTIALPAVVRADEAPPAQAAA